MYPILTASAENRQTIDVFGGYNHNLRINENEFYDMENLTSDVYPVLSPRKARGLYWDGADVQGMTAKDSLCFTAGGKFYINGYGVDMGLTEGEKQLVSMGAYVIILPDKKWINTMDTSKHGNIENRVLTNTDVVFSLCMADGEGLEVQYTGPTAPKEPKNMEYWLDTGSQKHCLKLYSASTSSWTTVMTTYVKISCPGIGIGFAQYDGIQIEGLEDALFDDLKALNGSAIVWARDDNYLVIVGLLDASRTVKTTINVSRTMPEMDYVTECNNRLWGCRYGLAENGEVVNEIYASKLGDFKNWKCYMGISTDSYAVSLGSDGPFTGAITHQGYPVFFKENCLHKMYGQMPSNFQIQTTACRGVQKGCSGSLAIVNEILYYKSRHAICAYDGSLPTEMSGSLGDIQYESAIAAARGNKYYVCMRETMSGAWTLLVFDTAKGLWHREDGFQAVQMCSCREDLYCATRDGKIITMLGSGDAFEQEVRWFAETGIINASSPDRAYLKRISVRMVLEPGSDVTISAQYDSCGAWESLGYFTGTDLRSFTVPVRPRRCDHLRLRLEGTGKAMVFSITKSMGGGSDKP